MQLFWMHKQHISATTLHNIPKMFSLACIKAAQAKNKLEISSITA